MPDKIQDKIQDKKHAENVSCKNIVLEEKQGLPDSSFEEGNEQQKGGSWTRNQVNWFHPLEKLI